MRTRLLTVPLLVLTLIGVPGCAKTRLEVYKADAAVYQAVKAISDTEIVLSNAGMLKPAEALKIETALRPVAEVALQVTIVLRDWKSGPMPPQLQMLVKNLGDLVQVIGSVLPDSPAKAALLEKVSLAEQAVLAVLSIVLAGGAA